LFENKIEKNKEYKEAYVQFMRKYESNDHLRRLGKSPFSEEDTNSCYLPHHAVWKGEEEKRKIRVVFDASVKPETRKGFNEMTITGGQT
jgi:hypothetical protein